MIMALSLKNRSQLLDLAEHYLVTKKPKQAAKVLSSVSLADTTIDTKRYLLLLGESFLEQKEQAKALDIYRQAAQKFPDDKEVHNYLIHGLCRAKETYLEAVSLTESMIAKYPDDFWYPYILGNAFRRFSDDIKKVEELLSQALALAPANIPVQELVFDVADRKDDAAQCKLAIDFLMKNSPDSIDTMTRLARYNLLIRQYSEAFAISKQALLRDPENIDALYVIELSRRYLSKNPIEKYLLATNDYIDTPANKVLGSRTAVWAKAALFAITWFAAFLRLLVILPILMIFSAMILCSFIVGVFEFPIFVVKRRTYLAGRIFDLAFRLR
jgi:tetratricopeptide (TPR) repeat protein